MEKNDLINEYENIKNNILVLIEEHKNDEEDIFEMIEENIILNVYEMSKIENVYQDKIKNNYTIEDLWEIFDNINKKSKKESEETYTLKLYKLIDKELWQYYMRENEEN